jgi:hypothetical protein
MNFSNKKIVLSPLLQILIRNPVPFYPWIWDPGWAKKSGSGSGINNADHISESLETLVGLKYLNSLVRIRDQKISDLGSGMEKFKIQDKHPGSATLS